MYQELEKAYENLKEDKLLLDSKLITLDQHIRALADYFYFNDDNEIGDWLWIASSIDRVDFNGMRQDAAFDWCSTAYYYETERQKVHSQLINSLTKFLYVYSGFESFLNKYDYDNCPSERGKINSIKYFLKTHYDSQFRLLPSYLEVVYLLRKFISIAKEAIHDLDKLFKTDMCTGFSGIGIKVVYKLRNKFAHGDFKFPEPLEWSGELSLEHNIIDLSIRVILFTIQMTMLADYKNSYRILSLYESESLLLKFGEDHEDFDWMIEESIFLKEIHYKIDHEKNIQYKLSFTA